MTSEVRNYDESTTTSCGTTDSGRRLYPLNIVGAWSSGNDATAGTAGGSGLVEFNRVILLLIGDVIEADESKGVYRDEERIHDGGERVHFDRVFFGILGS